MVLIYIYGFERGYNRKWTRRPVFTNAEGRNKTTQQNKPSNIGHEILDGVVSKSETFSVNKTQISPFQNIENCDIQQKIAENKYLVKPQRYVSFLQGAWTVEHMRLVRRVGITINSELEELDVGQNGHCWAFSTRWTKVKGI